MSLIKEYFELTDKYINDYGENTIVLMQVGSFFEVYGKKDNEIGGQITGSKITDFSQMCELNVVEKNVCVGKNKVYMAGFKDIMIEKYLKKIQEAGFTAIVYTQDQAAKNTTRSCAGIFSPGTYFSPDDNTRLTNNISCIWIETIDNKLLFKGKYVIIGVANIDVFTGKTSISQYKENFIHSHTTYDGLERFISIYNPSEVIIISNLPNEQIDDIIKFVNIEATSIHKINTADKNNTSNNIKVQNCEKQHYQKEILTKFYQVNDWNVFMTDFNENHIACQSFCFLLDFVYQHNPNLVNRISEPMFEDNSTNLHLANYSLKQLNIINDNTNGYKGKYSSVLNLLNDCLTPMGKRQFTYKLTNPTTNTEHLQNEYDTTEHIINNFASYSACFKEPLSTIKDLTKYQRLIFIHKMSPKKFLHIIENLTTIETICKEIENDTVLMRYVVNHLDVDCTVVKNAISKYLNVELIKEIDILQGFEVNFIQPNIDHDLDIKGELLKSSHCKLEAIRGYLNGLIHEKSKSGDFIKIHETEKNNYSLLCTGRRCKLLENSLTTEKTTVTLNYQDEYGKTIEFQYTLSKNQLDYKPQTQANYVITDPVIKELCKNISTIKTIMKDLITNVYNRFVVSFQEYKPQLERIIEFVTDIDILFNKASIAKKYNYCKPTIVPREKSFVDARCLRHCLIERLNVGGGELYVSNDIILGDNSNDGMLLYGTNAVGKTSLIRALGIAVIMAQSGLFVPCSRFEFMPYKYMFTRILGNDNLFKGLSTFAVEMSELRTILRLADPNSLILGDELCSGTEIVSAISIFVSGLQQLYKLGSSYIFATHLHEIVDYDEIKDIATLSVVHMEVVYDKEKDILIYDRKLKEGPGNNMYGLEVCKSLKLPEEFLNNAFEIRSKYNNQYRSILSFKTSHYNAKKIMGMCENCGERMGTEVHHLQHQRDANEEGIITKSNMSFHKNNLANLVTLCETCHHETHSMNDVGSKKVKTSRGYIINTL